MDDIKGTVCVASSHMCEVDTNSRHSKGVLATTSKRSH